jgi:hypothetical protein
MILPRRKRAEKVSQEMIQENWPPVGEAQASMILWNIRERP